MAVANLVIGIIAALAAVGAVLAALWGVKVSRRADRRDRRYQAREQLRELHDLAEAIQADAVTARSRAGRVTREMVLTGARPPFHTLHQDNLRRALAGVEIPLPKCRALADGTDAAAAVARAAEALDEISTALAGLDAAR